jgi:hypothetical protein
VPDTNNNTPNIDLLTTSSISSINNDPKISGSIKDRIKQHKRTAIIKHSKRTVANSSLISSTLTTSSSSVSTSKLSNCVVNHNHNNKLKILQININGIRNKISELNLLISETKPDIINIQESKLTAECKTPFVNGYTPARKDRVVNKGGGLLTYINSKLTFSEIANPNLLNSSNIELSSIDVITDTKNKVRVHNLYIPPRDSNTLNPKSEDQEITACFNYMLNDNNSIITGDINAHSKLWYNKNNDHRGNLISDLILNSDHAVLNSNSYTRCPNSTLQLPSSPDITLISNKYLNVSKWTVLHKLSSDHLPILTEIDLNVKHKPIQNRKSFTNYNKADWEKFTDYIDKKLSSESLPNCVHKGNSLLTKLILEADKIFIPKGKIKNHLKPLPTEIRELIKNRDKLQKQDRTDPQLQDLNKTISNKIIEFKQNLWKSKLNENWDHKTNSHILWKTLGNMSDKKTKIYPNRTITFNGNIKLTNKSIASSFIQQFTNITNYRSSKSNRKTDRTTKKLESTEEITITSNQTAHAIKNSKNNNSTGPDNINIKHLKHLGPIAIDYLTCIFNLSVNENIIPQIWKLSKIIPILKPCKDPNNSSSYRPISLLSPLIKTLEKVLLTLISTEVPNTEHQHGFKKKHSTSTALHNITDTIIKGFNDKRPPKRTILVSLDMSKAFDNVDLHILINKLHKTNINNTLIKFISNYIKGRKGYVIFNNVKSHKLNFKTGVPQGGVLSPTLFNIYMSDIPSPPPEVELITYADDLNTLTSHSNVHIAEQNLQPYLDSIHKWTTDNKLELNPIKSTATLFTTDPAEYNTQLNLNINNTEIPTVKHPKILGLTLDPKLNFAKHIELTKDKASKTINLLKSLSATNWGKQKETLLTTYKTLTRPVIEYANTIWSPIASATNITKLQIVQNNALRTVTGCTKDTIEQHLHEETKVLPIKQHLILHASQLRQKAQLPNHPLNKLTNPSKTKRLLKQTIFNNAEYTLNHDVPTNSANTEIIQNNMKLIHSEIVGNYLDKIRTKNKVLNDYAPEINKSELLLSRKARRRLAQLRTGKSPFLFSYLHKIDESNYPSPICPLCKTLEHTTNHLFSCSKLPTKLKTLDLWNDPVSVSALLEAWELRIADMGGL